MSEPWRVFAAIPVNDGVRSLMQHTQNRLSALQWPVRWVDPRLAHVTLRFYGDSDEYAVAGIRESLREASMRHERMMLETTTLGAFPSTSRARVLWLGFGGDVRRLRLMASDIHPDAVEAPGSGKSFKPHVTLARLRNGAAPLTGVAGASSGLNLPAVSQPVDRIQLVRSVLGPKGPSYTVIDEWMLQIRGAVPAVTTAGELHEHT